MCVPVRNVSFRLSFMSHKSNVWLRSLLRNKHRAGEASSSLFCICLSRAYTWTQEKPSLPTLRLQPWREHRESYGQACLWDLPSPTHNSPYAMSQGVRGQPSQSGARETSPHSLSQAHKLSFGFVFKCRQNVSPHLWFLTHWSHLIIHSLSNELRIFKRLLQTFSSGIKLLQIVERAEAGQERRSLFPNPMLLMPAKLLLVFMEIRSWRGWQPSPSEIILVPLQALQPADPSGLWQNVYTTGLAIPDPRPQLVSEITWYTGSSTSSSRIVYRRVREGRMQSRGYKARDVRRYSEITGQWRNQLWVGEAGGSLRQKTGRKKWKPWWYFTIAQSSLNLIPPTANNSKRSWVSLGLLPWNLPLVARLHFLQHV